MPYDHVIIYFKINCMKKLFISSCCCFLLLMACGQAGSTKNKQQQNNKQMTSFNNQLATPVLKLTKRQVIDGQGTGLVASTYLLPSDWQVRDQLYWEYRDPTVPIRYKSLMHSRESNMSIQVYPDVRASWTSSPSGIIGYPPPSDIITGMKDLIRVERAGKNINYVNQKVLWNNPQNSYQNGGQSTVTSQGGVIRVEYNENGQLFEEEFYGQLDIAGSTVPSAMGNIQSVIWGASGLLSCKAPKGKLDECRKIAQTFKWSVRLTKPFFNRLSQVVQLLTDQYYQQVYMAGQISKIISRTNDQMLANIDASYRQAQQTYDRANNQFSDYVRGVDRYSEGGSEVQLPSGYNHAWVNDRGEYLLTNTTGYDPGRDLNGNWRQLHKGN